MQADARPAPAIRAALQAPTEVERRIVELAYFGGWTEGEIAEMLTPLDTVRSSSRLGLLKLREVLLNEVEASP
ncbi:MAG: sigma factor-like helix-turn-helix DNA-binding protein [Solirubrobacteraceae bacterium]